MSEQALVNVSELAKANSPTVLSSDTNDNAQSDQLSINSASTEDLDALPGIGESYANKILQSIPYTDFEDLVARSGVPKATLEKIKSDISFDSL